MADKPSRVLIPVSIHSLPSSPTGSSPSDLHPRKKEQGEVMVEEKSTLRCRRRSMDAIPKFDELDPKYKDLILTLPKEERWLAFVMREYKGFWQSERYLVGIMTMEEAFKPHPSDIIVASYMKSGTTWLKALTFAIVHRNKYAFSHHPLLNLNPHDCVPFIEHFYAMQDEQYFETLPSPRVLGTHLHYSILPESIKTSECPIVYICREPKDVLVSLWYMVIKRYEGLNTSFPFAQAFELFCEGRMPYGPVWDHVLEYYKKNLQSPEKMLILKYEEMMKDPIKGVMKIANFIGCPFYEEEVKNGMVEEIVELCSFSKLKDLDVNKNGVGNVKNDCYFRKAIVGDWQHHMTGDMAAKVDQITKENLLDFGFTY